MATLQGDLTDLGLKRVSKTNHYSVHYSDTVDNNILYLNIKQKALNIVATPLYIHYYGFALQIASTIKLNNSFKSPLKAMSSTSYHQLGSLSSLQYHV